MKCPRCLYRGRMLFDGYGNEECINCGFTPTEPIPEEIMATVGVRDPKPERKKRTVYDSITNTLMRER